MAGRNADDRRPARVLIEMSGGVIQAIHADQPGVTVEVFDWDEVEVDRVLQRPSEYVRDHAALARVGDDGDVELDLAPYPHKVL